MKNGFTLIELIFTIVILAITTMAIPRMVAQTAELNVFAIKQELVMNAKTVMAQLAKTPWDSAYKMVVCNQDTDPAVALTAEQKKLNADACEKPIHIQEIANGNADIATRFYSTTNSKRLVVKLSDDIDDTLKNKTGSSSYGVVGGYNDLDDYNDYNIIMKPPRDVKGGNTTGDYLLDTNITVSVGYVGDAVLKAGESYATSNVLNATLNTATVAGPTNIKVIAIRASDMNDANRDIVLRSYSFNIGFANPAINERY